MHEREVEKKVMAALEREPRINLHKHPIKVEFNDDTLVLEGEVEHIAAKKFALELAAALPGVAGIVDRLRVDPGKRLGDGEIRDRLLARLSSEIALHDCDFEVEVDDGVVTLNGTVKSLAHKRLAGVLAWWTPGVRDVVNGLEVIPPQEDNDTELAESVSEILEKDPYVDASRIGVTCRDGVVMLDGFVLNDVEKMNAENDAWSIFGVDGVINRLQIT